MQIRRTFSEQNDVALFCGNCVRLLRKIPDGTVRLVVTSPPYNVGKEYEENLTIEDYLKLQKTVIDGAAKVESENQFSLTRAVLSRYGRAQNQFLISNSYQCPCCGPRALFSAGD
jgi:adenine-specific DNA-methyltransferase